ncbi:hypothetical protein E0Z10_g7905 [Xylaria hypoxylon]|uniref:Chromo domain-containing protein n=1 Tax=Xylaria hypoxylon TaxID=37992 RepID=A0A4Z0YCQ8_9PEZI|nr:hypothetical protein E0Z10_g7905 [Xylaria hypoxylon]
MDMASSSAVRTRHNPDSDGNDGAHSSNPIANIQSDSLRIQNGEGEPDRKEENQGADDANDGAEEDDALKPVLKTKPKKGGNTVAFDDEDTRDNNQDNKQGQAHDSNVPERGRSRFARAQPLKSSTRLVMPTKQQRPIGGLRGSTTRRPGRRLKGIVVNRAYSSTSSGSGPKKKRAAAKEAYQKHCQRRSTRAAAKSATQQITQQIKSPRATATPPTLGPTKATTRSTSKAITKALPMRPAKTEYEVELILDTRTKSGTTEYLVKWKGWHVTHNSWEPAANLTHCTQALKEFRSAKR